MKDRTVIFQLGLYILCSLLSAGCSDSGASQKSEQAPPFELLSTETTQLTFTNQPALTDSLNVFNYMYFYNGGGLACGDFNNDGRPDLFFTANLDYNALFLNDGDMRFRDVSAMSGLRDTVGWFTGASVVDINQDGLLDIYVMQVSGYAGLRGHNRLYVNEGTNEQGIPLFSEQAERYGLNQTGFGTQAVFFDFDGDGDLDCFQLNHSVHQNGTFGPRERFNPAERHPLAGDRLLRNDGPAAPGGAPVFTEVSAAAGILGTALGYGLGVAVGDVNNDGWPDLYVGNDFHENDYLYLNRGDGAFEESLTDMVAHTSRFTMGVDIADLNGDGHSEIFTLDMLPEDPVILKQSLAEDGYDIFRFKLGFGYNPQFSRNTLQYNNGDGTFSEIAAQAGIHASDWSWAPLFLDWDDDGRLDLFVSNGIPRRMNDIDWINFKTSDNRSGGAEVGDELEYVDKMPQIKLKNKFYHHSGPVQFDDVSSLVSASEPSYSNSAVYCDLDGDGDLDIVTNNLYDQPFIYRNNYRDTDEPGQVGENAYLILSLTGPADNRNAVGASAVVYRGNDRQRIEHYPARGFQSSVAAPLHLGVGDSSTVDSIVVVWPDGTYTNLSTLRFNRERKVVWEPDLPHFIFKDLGRPASTARFADVTEAHGIRHRHRENEFVDFNREPLIPHMVSAEGPALCTGDLNGDGLADFFVGSSKFEASQIYFQDAAGQFARAEVPVLRQDSVFEDVDAAFADLDADGDLDIIVAAGGNEFSLKHPPRKQRAYRNDGSGNFSSWDVLPDLYLTASAIVPGDVNGDGLIDLAVLGRVVPGDYGSVPPSHLFLNTGGGRFEDVTQQLMPALGDIGRVADGKFADLDGDGHLDLIVAVEWGHVIAFLRRDNGFVARQVSEYSGWWTTVATADVDGDGDLDVLAGNYGTNNKLRPSPEEPLRLYVNDFDGNGSRETVLTYYVGGREIPFANYKELTKQLPGLKKKYIYARDLARATPEELFGARAWEAATVATIETMESQWLEQLADGTFRAHALPDPLQWSSLHAIFPLPSSDGDARFLVGGNFTRANIEMGWYDAGRTSELRISPQGDMTVSRLEVARDGELRRVAALSVPDQPPAYLLAFNNDSLRLIQQR